MKDEAENGNSVDTSSEGFGGTITHVITGHFWVRPNGDQVRQIAYGIFDGIFLETRSGLLILAEAHEAVSQGEFPTRTVTYHAVSASSIPVCN